MPRRDSNILEKSCTRPGPLKDALPTELQHLGRQTEDLTLNLLSLRDLLPIVVQVVEN